MSPAGCLHEDDCDCSARAAERQAKCPHRFCRDCGAELSTLRDRLAAAETKAYDMEHAFDLAKERADAAEAERDRLRAEAARVHSVKYDGELGRIRSLWLDAEARLTGKRERMCLCGDGEGKHAPAGDRKCWVWHGTPSEPCDCGGFEDSGLTVAETEKSWRRFAETLTAERTAHEETRRQLAITQEAVSDDLEEFRTERAARVQAEAERDAIDVQLQQTQADYGAAEAALSRARRVLNDIEGYEIDWAKGAGENMAAVQNMACAALNEPIPDPANTPKPTTEDPTP